MDSLVVRCGDALGVGLLGVFDKKIVLCGERKVVKTDEGGSTHRGGRRNGSIRRVRVGGG